MKTEFTFIPTYYKGRKGYRPAVRVMRDNKMVGSKAAPFLFDRAELALAHAKTAAAFVAAGEHNVWAARVANSPHSSSRAASEDYTKIMADCFDRVETHLRDMA